MDQPYFIGPFWLLPGVQHVQLSTLAFKSQRYRVQCQSNKKLLHHSMQEINLIHKLILMIQQILGLLKLNGQAHL